MERNARHAWSNNQRALAPQPGCQEEGTRTLQGYRSLRSLNPRQHSLHRSAVPAREYLIVIAKISGEDIRIAIA